MAAESRFMPTNVVHYLTTKDLNLVRKQNMTITFNVNQLHLLGHQLLVGCCVAWRSKGCDVKAQERNKKLNYCDLFLKVTILCSLNPVFLLPLFPVDPISSSVVPSPLFKEQRHPHALQQTNTNGIQYEDTAGGGDLNCTAKANESLTSQPFDA